MGWVQKFGNFELDFREYPTVVYAQWDTLA